MTKYWIRAMALIGLASITFAFEQNITWTPPVFYTDGTPLLEQDLDYYTVYCDGASLTVIDSIIGTWSALVNFPETPGTHNCHLTVTTLAGVESDASNPYVFTVADPKPGTVTVVWPL